VPLAGLGDRAAALVSDGLREAGIALHADELAEVPDPHLVTLPRERAALDVDRVLASPVLRGRKIEGLPADADGFVPVDRHGRVTGAPDVFAAGDITAGPLKYGAFGTQQAEAVARAVAFRAGADVERIPYAPAAAGALLTAAGPRALDAVAMNDEPAWPDAKRSGHRLGPCLEAIDAARAAGSPQALA
jgi:sulfide:quinone oxidoreductase